MKNVVIGQLAQLTWNVEGENAAWEYYIVKHVFDNRIQLESLNGHKYMHVLDSEGIESEIIGDQPAKSNLTMLYKDGKPAMAKRKLFGGYKVKPSK